MTAPYGTARRRRLRLLPHTFRQWLATLVGLLALFVLAVGIAYAATGLPNANALSTQQATLIYYADGHTVLGRLGALNRVSVPLTKVPEHVRLAVLAAEDRNFYSEPGISFTGIARALWTNLRGGDVQQGGSTITQQYAKNAYLTQQRTLSRKLKEIFISVKLSQDRSKNEILADYLNTIYFGRGAYGIQAASQAYFGKDVSRLTVAQGAVLAAVIRSPSYYDPAQNPEQAKRRWQYVLDGMVKQHWLDPAEAAATRYPTVMAPRPVSTGGDGPNGYIVAAVKRELAQQGFGEERLNIGGYKVVTTIDKTAQDAAVAAERSILPPSPHGPLSALVSVQPGNGAIRAMYGGADYANPAYPKSFYNLATDFPRQPGSSMKPYTLIGALQAGVGLGSTFDGKSPQTFAGGYVVHNSGGEQCPSCRLDEALAKSVNTVFVPLALKVGPAKVAHVAHQAGIPDSVHLSDNLAGITLGIDSVPVIDQAVGYATIAAQGVRAKPYLVAEVSNASGDRVYTAHPHTDRVFDPAVMSDTTYAMTKVLDCGTGGTACGKALPGRPAAGKTGTTDRNQNAWFIGFTPQLATAVWIGMPDPNMTIPSIGSSAGEVFGGGPPAQIWQQMMTAALAGKPVMDFPPPAHVGTDINSAPSPTATPVSAAPSVSAAPKHARSPSPSPSPTGGGPGLFPSGPPGPPGRHRVSPSPGASTTAAAASSP